MVKRVCLVSSGTGGHLWPALVLGDALRERGHETVLLTEGRLVERELLERVGCPAQSIDVRGRGIARVLRLAKGTVDARRMLRAQRADAVVCTGGGTSVAVGLAGRSLGLPLALLEQNAVAGRANRLLARFADRLYFGLPPTGRVPRGLLTGTPVRKAFRSTDPERARRGLELRADLPVVLVTGGSQGAGILNERVPEVLCALRRPVQVLHLTGPDHDEVVRRRYLVGHGDGVVAVVRPLALDMAELYAAADLVVCRGGGCTVSELIAAGRPAVIVPYPHHRDRQQWHNARVLETAGAATVLEQSAATTERLRAEIGGLLDDRPRLATMAAAAAGLRADDASSRIVDDLERLVLR